MSIKYKHWLTSSIDHSERELKPTMTHSFWYFATPYSLAPDRATAYREAVEQTALLIDAGWIVFSPIVHSHEIDRIKPQLHQFWMNFDRPFIIAAKGLIVCKLNGWESSRGVTKEIADFTKMGKPILFMEPGRPLDLDEIIHTNWTKEGAPLE